MVAAGGNQVSDNEFGTFVADVMKSGARGLAAGRNIFKAADPAAKVREVRSILHAHSSGAPQQSAVPIAAWASHDKQVDGGVIPGLQPGQQEKVS